MPVHWSLKIIVMYTFCPCDQIYSKPSSTNWFPIWTLIPLLMLKKVVESSWKLMAHGDAREGKWRGNWWLEWVASTLTLTRNTVYPALLTLMRTPRLSVLDWTGGPADLNGLARFAERPTLFSARVPSHFKRSLQIVAVTYQKVACFKKAWYLSIYGIKLKDS
jgi:hypothetical protein